ncbi:hypothetical protein ACFWPA_14670 [Rhodococcus sp. NPDC058505]|uniref:hypothetical protein n=1 Tax=unclassified Rhodococcus (in: high G+C Gram-positive bacteria) TaxID=192944 RepID=UPI00364D8CFC
MTDATMDAIAEATMLGRGGATDAARARLLDLWEEITPSGDALHRCTLAHYVADLHTDPAQALVWDVRALDAAAALTDERTERHHPGLRVAGFYPSLHLNIADNLRRLGSFDAAGDHLAAARRCEGTLGDDEYGAMIRGALHEVEQQVARRSTAPRPTPQG